MMPDRSPLVSVIIPSFNQAPFLEACLRSVLDQDYPSREVIVVDGGSSDGSVEILQRYSGLLARWTSEPDQGQAQAVNKGWSRARGQILGWLNSDDQYLPGALARVVAAYRARPEAAMLYGDVNEIDQDGAVKGCKHMAEFSLRSLLLGKNMGQPGVFVTRAAQATAGGLDETLHYALDFDYFLRLWLAFPADRMVHVPAVLAASRLWPATKSSLRPELFGQEYRRVLERVFARGDLSPETRALRRQAFSRSVLFRQARLYLESRAWRKGYGWLLRAAIGEPIPLEKARMLWFGLRYLLPPGSRSA